MSQRKFEISGKSEQELLSALLMSEEKAEYIASSFRLEQLSTAHQRELGLTPKRYERLMAALEIGRRIQQTSLRKPTKIRSSSDAIQFCRTHFAQLINEAQQEEFHVVTLNTKNTVIDTHRVTVGTLDASLVHPREVFRVAIKDVCSTIILAHNHPSGDPTPSREDIAVTDRLEESGKLLGIDVLDHIVMGKEGCVSIREQA